MENNERGLLFSFKDRTLYFVILPCYPANEVVSDNNYESNPMSLIMQREVPRQKFDSKEISRYQFNDR